MQKYSKPTEGNISRTFTGTDTSYIQPPGGDDLQAMLDKLRKEIEESLRSQLEDMIGSLIDQYFNSFTTEIINNEEINKYFIRIHRKYVAGDGIRINGNTISVEPSDFLDVCDV